VVHHRCDRYAACRRHGRTDSRPHAGYSRGGDTLALWLSARSALQGLAGPAHRGGIKTVLIPRENEKSVDEIPQQGLKNVTLLKVEYMDEVTRWYSRIRIRFSRADEVIKKMLRPSLAGDPIAYKDNLVPIRA
jgi:hypothetical protein